MRFHAIIYLVLLLTFTQCKTIKTAEPEIAIQDIPLIVQPLSTVNIPLSINLTPQLKDVEKSIPKKLEGEENMCEGVSYSYTIHRFPIKFTGKNDVLNYSIPCEYALRLNYCPSCTELFSSKGSCVIPRVYASCGVGEPMRKLEISYGSKIGIDKSWKLTSTTTLSTINAVDPCKVTFMNYDATDDLLKEVKSTLKDLEKDIDQSISEIDLKPMMQEVWTAMNEPMNLEGYGYLYLNPKKLALGKINFDKTTANINLNLSLQPKLNFESLNNETPNLPSLSNFTSGEGYELIVDIEANYDSLNTLFQSNIVGQEINYQGKKIVFEDVKIHSSKNQKLNIALTISGTKKGILYFEGTPVFHSLTQEISIPDLTFDVKTRSALIKSAKWLFSSKIEQKLQEATHFDLKPQLKELSKLLETELNTEIDEGVYLSGTVKSTEIMDIYPFTEQLYLRIKLKGKLALKM